MELKKDGGYKSRKFVITVLAFVFILVGAIIASLWPAFVAQYPTFVGGILGAAAVYLGGNVTNDYLNTKVKATVEVAKSKTEPVTPQVASQQEDEDGE